MTPLPKHGVYAITDAHLIPKDSFIDTVERAILGGVNVLQYRDKRTHAAQRLLQARALRQLCDKYHIPFIINDDISLALQVNADGVHLGKDDPALPRARFMLGDRAIIGVSCYNDLQRVQEAAQQGASYIALGSFFPSLTKPEAVAVNFAFLQQVRKHVSCPIVAIGGITPENGADVLQQGADFIAAIHGIFGQNNVTLAAQRYNRLFHAMTLKETA
jgi:thiamine-phosphate pyrophosphorylase